MASIENRPQIAQMEFEINSKAYARLDSTPDEFALLDANI
jgi:hypothetical protein